jgi:hypothetical protein
MCNEKTDSKSLWNDVTQNGTFQSNTGQSGAAVKTKLPNDNES